MYITRFNPFNQLREFERNFFKEYPVRYREEDDVASFTPHVNSREGEFAYHIDADLPGIKKEDIKIDIKDGNITISGERNFKEEVKEEDYYRVETRFGKFSRSFALPEHVDTENITASCTDGVLEIVLPKLPEVDSVKSIEIK